MIDNYTCPTNRQLQVFQDNMKFANISDPIQFGEFTFSFSHVPEELRKECLKFKNMRFIKKTGETRKTKYEKNIEYIMIEYDFCSKLDVLYPFNSKYHLENLLATIGTCYVDHIMNYYQIPCIFQLGEKSLEKMYQTWPLDKSQRLATRGQVIYDMVMANMRDTRRLKQLRLDLDNCYTKIIETGKLSQRNQKYNKFEDKQSKYKNLNMVGINDKYVKTTTIQHGQLIKAYKSFVRHWIKNSEKL